MEQNDKLAQRRKVKADRMQIKKLRIERDQLDSFNAKELDLNQQKFDKQIVEMERVVDKELDKQTNILLDPSANNKE